MFGFNVSLAVLVWISPLHFLLLLVTHRSRLSPFVFVVAPLG